MFLLMGLFTRLRYHRRRRMRGAQSTSLHKSTNTIQRNRVNWIEPARSHTLENSRCSIFTHTHTQYLCYQLRGILHAHHQPTRPRAIRPLRYVRPDVCDAMMYGVEHLDAFYFKYDETAAAATYTFNNCHTF